MLLAALKLIATLETSLEANYDGRTRDKATYRGPSYRSAQKYWTSLEIKRAKLVRILFPIYL